MPCTCLTDTDCYNWWCAHWVAVHNQSLALVSCVLWHWGLVLLLMSLSDVEHSWCMVLVVCLWGVRRAIVMVCLLCWCGDQRVTEILCRYLAVCSRFFQKICHHRGKAGVSKSLLSVVKSHVATEHNAVMSLTQLCISVFPASECSLIATSRQPGCTIH